MWVPPKEVTETAFKILKETGAIENFTDWITRKEAWCIIVLGASGTGKTSLAKRLRGVNSAIPRHMRTHSVEFKNAKLAGMLKIQYIETPGQLDDVYKTERFKAIQRAMAKPNLGIINVTSYGYHEGIASKDDATTQTHKAKLAYLDSRRREELMLTQEWCNLLCRKGGAAKWLITVCSKADLWWSSTTEEPIVRYYDSGTYFSQARRGAHC
jgi:hypothetical protein